MPSAALGRWPSGALKRFEAMPVATVRVGNPVRELPDELELELEALCAAPGSPAVNEHVVVRYGLRSGALWCVVVVFFAGMDSHSACGLVRGASQAHSAVRDDCVQ